MGLRTVMIFPEFENMEVIDEIRRKYDPLEDLVRPHITMVFPFENSMNNEELAQILEQNLQNIHSFELELGGFTKQEDRFGNYLFLNVVKGAEEITHIHDLLYDSELREFDLGYGYVPHMTVGKLPTKELMDEAYAEISSCEDIFKTTIRKISVEEIGENEESIVVIEKELEKSLNAINIPESIQKLIDTTEYKTDSIGMSNSSFLLFDDKVLKIEVDWYESENEFQVMKWLKDKLPVPEVMCREKKDGKSYFLMSKIPGKMLCDDMYLTNLEELVDLLVKALQMLWQVDISACPSDAEIDRKLQMAKYNIEHDTVDLDNVEPETFGEGGFENTESLLEWLIQNKPTEELVFSHGDFCLPNIFAKDGEISGFIDLGRAGVADKYQDIAICYRSLKHNMNGRYSGTKYENFNPDILFEKLGITPDWNKIRYYILLDELF